MIGGLFLIVFGVLMLGINLSALKPFIAIALIIIGITKMYGCCKKYGKIRSSNFCWFCPKE
jgi:hypothetical protein